MSATNSSSDGTPPERQDDQDDHNGGENPAYAVWQSTTIRQMGFVVNILITLSVAGLGFTADQLINFERNKVDAWVSNVFMASGLVSFLISIAFGLWCSRNRLDDLRIMRDIVRTQFLNSNAIYGKFEIDIIKRRWKLQDTLQGPQLRAKLRIKTVKVDHRAWSYFRIQQIAFEFGIVFTSLSVLIFQASYLNSPTRLSADAEIAKKFEIWLQIEYAFQELTKRLEGLSLIEAGPPLKVVMQGKILPNRETVTNNYENTIISVTSFGATNSLPAPLSLGFNLVGGDSGIPLSAATINLVNSQAISLRPERVLSTEGPDTLLHRVYSLPDWVDITSLVDALCRLNAHVCSDYPKPVWRLQDRPDRTVSDDACKVPAGQPPKLPTSHVCVPAIQVAFGPPTHIIRRFSKSEIPRLPKVVTQNTRGCDEFNFECQLDILKRNTGQRAAWDRINKENVVEDGFKAEAGQPIQWWLDFAGDVTVPAASLNVITNTVLTEGEANSTCTKLEIAVRDGNRALRQARKSLLGTGDAPTGVINTSCESSIKYVTSRPNRAQAAVERLFVNDADRDRLVPSWRKAMHWPAQVENGKDLTVGIWDGPVARVTEFTRNPNQYPKLRQRSGVQKRNNEDLPEGSIIAWIDNFPAEISADPPKGPCGEAVEYPIQAHATLIAGMLVSQKQGLVPGLRLWNHVWDGRRIMPQYSQWTPRASVNWFMESVIEAPALLHPTWAPYINNLSCGTSTPDPSGATWLSEAIAGRPLSGQQLGISPYAVAVAAGNRLDTGDLDQPMQDVDGYSMLSHQIATAGFISVVGLDPSGQDILRCKHIQDLFAASLTDVSGAPANASTVTSFCPLAGGDPEAAEQALVHYGPAFDVAAVGLGVGPTEDDHKWAVMWGSSFAAPYVTAAIAQIVSKARRMGVRSYDRLAANLIADRIRITADLSDRSISRYGIINLDRALSFQRDAIEPAPRDSNEANWGEDQKAFKRCVDAGGTVEVDRSREATFYLPILNSRLAARLPLLYVLRLSSNHDGSSFRAILRTASDKMLETAVIDGRTVDLPAVCHKDDNSTGDRMNLALIHIDNFTRCSFVNRENCP